MMETQLTCEDRPPQRPQITLLDSEMNSAIIHIDGDVNESNIGEIEQEVKSELGLPTFSNLALKFQSNGIWKASLETMTSNCLENDNCNENQFRLELKRLREENQRLLRELRLAKGTTTLSNPNLPNCTIFDPKTKTEILLLDAISEKYSLIDIALPQNSSASQSSSYMWMQSSKYKKNFCYLSISIRDSSSISTPSINSLGNSFHLLPNTACQIIQQIGISIPMSFVIDKNGAILIHGSALTWPQIESKLDNLEQSLDSNNKQSTLLTTAISKPTDIKAPSMYPSHNECIGQYFDNRDMKNLSSNIMQSTNCFSGKITIIDFWSTACPNCPKAVTMLNNRAAECMSKDIVSYVSINVDNPDKALNLIQQYNWSSLDHYYVTLEVKEHIKRQIGMTRLPHCLVLDKTGNVYMNGSNFSWARFDSFIQNESLAALASSKLFISPKELPVSYPSHEVCLGSTLVDVTLVNVVSKKASKLLPTFNGRITIIDFWSTTCQRCPNALIELNKLSAKSKMDGIPVSYVAINVNDLESSVQAITKHGCANLDHYHINLQDKEKIKLQTGMTQLPHCLVLDQGGKLLMNGKTFSQSSFDLLVQDCIVEKNTSSWDINEQKSSKSINVDHNVKTNLEYNKENVMNVNGTISKNNTEGIINEGGNKKGLSPIVDNVPVSTASTYTFTLDEEF